MVSVGTKTALEYANLAAFTRDLEESIDALETALSFRPPRSERESSLRSHLLSSAVIAYWRCFPTSLGKLSLDSFVPIPLALEGPHKRSKYWRDKSVAHSDSAMKRSIALLVLDNDEGKITNGVAVTLSAEVSVPDHEVEAFRALAVTIFELLTIKMNEAGERLQTEFTPSEVQKLWDRPDNNQDLDESVLQWDPTKKRLTPFVSISIPTSTAD